MEIKDDLPLPAYYKLCDHIEKRINTLQVRGCNVNMINDRIVEIPISKKTFDKCNQLRIKLCEIKQILEQDNLEKIDGDIDKLLEVVKKRVCS